MSYSLVREYESERPINSITVNWENIHNFNTAEVAVGNCNGSYSDPSRGPTYANPDSNTIRAQSKFINKTARAVKQMQQTLQSDQTLMQELTKELLIYTIMDEKNKLLV